MKYFALALFAMSLGCGHAQVTPTPQKNVDLSWTAPTNPACGTSCTYDVSRITLASGTTSCPAVNYTTPNYTPLNSSNPVSTVTYSDTAASGLTACYIVQTVQNSQVSLASNAAGPFFVPPVPRAPSISGAVAETKEPALPMPSGSEAPVLSAKLTTIR